VVDWRYGHPNTVCIGFTEYYTLTTGIIANPKTDTKFVIDRLTDLPVFDDGEREMYQTVTGVTSFARLT